MRIPYKQLMGDAEDHELVIPGPRKPDLNAEWRLQAKCVKLLRRKMRTDENLRFIAPGAEGFRDGKQSFVAKAMGRLDRGVPDLWMIRRLPQGSMVRLRLCVVEFKRPGGKLTPEQRGWFDWLPCERYMVDNVMHFEDILREF